MTTMLQNTQAARRQTFSLYLIKPSHYDDDGYPIQWVRAETPSNTMGVLNGLAMDCQRRQVLGDNVDIVVETLDEIHRRIRPEKIIRTIQANGGKGLIAILGVQSNQYPRAVDIGRKFRAAGLPVCIGGFHVSGSLSMIPDDPPGVQEALDLGISVFAGEAEGRFEQVLTDAYNDELKPLYNYLADMVSLGGAPVPYAPQSSLDRNMSAEGTVDAGRGCPFQCSFCTIINVQGRRTRARAPDDIEKIIRQDYARGLRALFITDDNFARNKQWEPIFDRIIELREQHGVGMRLMIQVDTLCHKIPNFIEKARRAGVKYVFIGLENVNPDNLLAAKKKQNKIGEYRNLLLGWKRAGIITFCGYIVGFPNDTPERVARDIETIKRELPVDVVEFFCLTPLPGSEDHKVLFEKGAWLEPDLNKYDTEHICSQHPLMSDEQWLKAYREAWRSFYSVDHVETVLRRAAACEVDMVKISYMLLFVYMSVVVEGVHPMQSGLFRLQYRRDRRYGLPLESPWSFYPRVFWTSIVKSAKLAGLAWKFRRVRKRVENDPQKLLYADMALTPAAEETEAPAPVVAKTLPPHATIGTAAR